MTKVRLYPKGLQPSASAFFLRWKKQPPEECKSPVIKYNSKGEIIFLWAEDNDPDRVWRWHTKMPCQSGDTAYLCEWWAVDIINGVVHYYYKTDIPKEFLYLFDWCSPATMPNIACRNVWLIGKVEAVQVKDIVLKMIYDFRKLGFMRSTELFDWYTTTYPGASLNDWCWHIEKG